MTANDHAMDKQASSVHDSWNQDTLDTSSLNGKASLVQSNMEQDPTANGANRAKNETCTTFTCFPELPVELRCKIWREVCFRRRNICISFKELGHWVEEDEHGHEVSPFRAFMYLSDSTHPTILHASHESRTEGLKHYTLDFGVENFTRGSQSRVLPVHTSIGKPTGSVSTTQRL